MVLLHQMVACAECHQVRIVGWCRDGHAAGTADIRMAQLIGEALKVISGEVIVIP